MNKKLILLIAVGIALFFQLFRLQVVPMCLNADEAAFGYNAYSIFKTGADEYGDSLPLRLLSFRDFKLPLYSYLSVPFIATLGLTDFSVRALNMLLGVLLVPLMYFVIRELFDDERIALVAALTTSLNTSHYILSRHAHEGVLCAVLILIATLFYLKFRTSRAWQHFAITNGALLLASFSYHSARVFLILFAVLQIWMLFRKRNFRYIAVVIAILLIPFAVDLRYGANRVASLAFYKDIGFSLRITEALNEHGIRPLHNKATQAVIEISERYFTQFSPQFLAFQGDGNPRFGMQGIGIVTPVEYVLLFIGLYFLFAKKSKHRGLILALLLITPLPSALTWTVESMVRTYFMIFIVIAISSFGAVSFFDGMKNAKHRTLALLAVLGLYGFFTLSHWDTYLYHYPKKADNIRAWQCGYKELAAYVKENYDAYDSFYITPKNGQPYIYFLYYMGYDPSLYQKRAVISEPDEYGFGQVEKLEKMSFEFKYDPSTKRAVSIGFPDDFAGTGVTESQVKKISSGTEDIFWIKETP